MPRCWNPWSPRSPPTGCRGTASRRRKTTPSICSRAWNRPGASRRRPSVPAPALSPFQYAVIRVVPRIERGECFNAGVVLFCRPKRFLAARTALDESRLAALAPDADADMLRAHLDALVGVAHGAPEAGPIAAL